MLDGQRLWNDLEALKQFTATPGAGVTRLSFSEEDKKARAYLKQRMEEVGLEVREHPCGNIIGRLPGRDNALAPVLCGSHFDTVRHGGAYDGIYGVVAAIEAAASIARDGYPLRPLEVIAFVEEEGTRFHKGLMGSSAMLGMLSPAEIAALTDDDGVLAEDAMRDCGLQPGKIAESVLPKGSISAFVELHIEQGPVLENEGREIGIVQRINSMQFAGITVSGRADHAGTTPMNMRRDALSAALSLIGRLYRMAEICGSGATVTVGQLSVEPGSANVVPGKVEFSLDYRSQNMAAVAQMRAIIDEELKRTEQEGFPCAYREFSGAPAIDMDPSIMEMIRSGADAFGYSAMYLPSGAGHDAMNFARLCPVGMIFVPSEGGRSHCPEEYTSPAALEKGARVLEYTLRQLCERT